MTEFLEYNDSGKKVERFGSCIQEACTLFKVIKENLSQRLSDDVHEKDFVKSQGLESLNANDDAVSFVNRQDKDAQEW